MRQKRLHNLMPTHHFQVKCSRFWLPMSPKKGLWAVAVRAAWASAPSRLGHDVHFHRLAEGDGALDAGFQLGGHFTTLHPG